MKTSFEKAIEIALANGYNRDRYISREHALLDPEFFQALGKGLGWTVFCLECNHHVAIWQECGCDEDEVEPKPQEEWKYQWHRFIDHLIEGKDIESFFTNLTK